MEDSIEHPKNRQGALERADAFIKEGERKQAEEEAPLAHYEHITIHGTFLVDGHHIFIEFVRNINSFNDYVNASQDDVIDHEQRWMQNIIERGIVTNCWIDPHPVDVADVATMNIITPLQDILPLEIARQYIDTNKQCVADRDIIAGRYRGPDRYCAVNIRAEVLVFDARMPPISEIIRKLTRQHMAYSRWRQEAEKFRIDYWLKLVEAGYWEFQDADGPIRVPFNFKNAFLDALTHEWYGWKESLGKRKIDIASRGYIQQKEKGVDARLIIAGCDAAADPKVDWVCLVTNDSDYVPLIEHIQSRGKRVYLLSLCNPKCQSRDLQDAVGMRNIINKNDLLNGFSIEEVPEPYRTNPEILMLFNHCVSKELASQLGGFRGAFTDPVKRMELLKRYDDELNALNALIERKRKGRA